MLALVLISLARALFHLTSARRRITVPNGQALAGASAVSGAVVLLIVAYYSGLDRSQRVVPGYSQ